MRRGKYTDMPLFAFLDESGNYTYTREQGNILVYCAVVTTTPSLFCHDFSLLKYEFHAAGNCLERFHATEDAQAVRDRVFGIIARSTGFAVHSIILRKNRANPALRKYGVYSTAYKTLLRYLVGRGALDRLCIVVDTVPDKSQRATLKSTLQTRAAEILNARGIPFTIEHHNSSAHSLLQVADYCAWAIYRKWQNQDERSYLHIRARIANEFDIFQRGTVEYY
jgi:Protein of unknown function (DUF3800)